jgi:hypothetical protein
MATCSNAIARGEAQWVNAVKTEDETHLKSVGDGSHNVADHQSIQLENNNDSPESPLQIIALAHLYSSLDLGKILSESTEIKLETPFW